MAVSKGQKIKVKKVRDNASGAIGGYWIWKHEETGHVVRHSNYRGCMNEVKKFLRANDFPITSQFEEEFEQNICKNGAPNLCIDFEPPTLAQKMSTLGMALYQAAKNWRQPIVSVEELQARREICTECNFYAGSTSLLKIACSKCGCSGLKLAIKSSVCPVGKWN